MSYPESNPELRKPVIIVGVAAGAMYLFVQVVSAVQTGDFLQPIGRMLVLLALLGAFPFLLDYTHARRFVPALLAVVAFVVIDLATTYLVPIQELPSLIYFLTQFFPLVGLIYLGTLLSRRSGWWP